MHFLTSFDYSIFVYFCVTTCQRLDITYDATDCLNREVTLSSETPCHDWTPLSQSTPLYRQMGVVVEIFKRRLSKCIEFTF